MQSKFLIYFNKCKRAVCKHFYFYSLDLSIIKTERFERLKEAQLRIVRGKSFKFTQYIYIYIVTSWRRHRQTFVLTDQSDTSVGAQAIQIIS